MSMAARMPRLDTAAQWPLWKSRTRGVLTEMWEVIDIKKDDVAAVAADGSPSSLPVVKVKLDAAAQEAFKLKSMRAYSFFMQVLGDEPLALVIPRWCRRTTRREYGVCWLRTLSARRRRVRHTHAACCTRPAWETAKSSTCSRLA